MRGSIRLFKVFGISINIHITFFLLFILGIYGGFKWLFLIMGVFFFVTVHELSHSLMARRFGIMVREITLLPIGGVASMAKMPENPRQEFLISIVGPLSNIAILVIFFYPMKLLLGADVLFHDLSTLTWPLTIAYLYWINLMLAGFNLIPAFPMDGGRVLRAVLASKIGYQKATKIAVMLGHVFALIFVFMGIKYNVFLVAIAIFIYFSASSEEVQVNVKETLKKFRVRDILPRDFIILDRQTTLAKVLEHIFHSHQEDFPVVENKELVGFVTRQDIMTGIHAFGMEKPVGEVMRKAFPKVKDSDLLIKVQELMHAKGMRALPVMKDGILAGVITIEDISRAYAVASQRP